MQAARGGQQGQQPAREPLGEGAMASGEVAARERSVCGPYAALRLCVQGEMWASPAQGHPRACGDQHQVT